MSFWDHKRTLITGVTGFSGRHLSGLLLDAGASVAGFDLRPPDPPASFKFHPADLLAVSRVEEILAQTRPEALFHLAVVLKSREPDRFYQVNSAGTAALMEAVIRTGLLPTLILVSSSAVYGTGSTAAPITEDDPPAPETHYGLSKLAQEWIAARYFQDHRLPVVTCRTFNLSGPGLPDGLVLSSFARQIVSAERGEIDEIRTGNLDARRDFIDVRDAVRAYALLAELGEPGLAYNVCAGRAYSIRDCLDILLSFSPSSLQVVPDPGLQQSNDVPVQVGDPTRLKVATGWEPAIPLEQSLHDLLDYWRSRPDPRDEGQRPIHRQ